MTASTQPTEKQVPNRERHSEFDRLAVGGCDRDDAVSIPLVDRFDGSCRPAVDIVARFPSMESVMVHTSRTVAVVLSLSMRVS